MKENVSCDIQYSIDNNIIIVNGKLIEFDHYIETVVRLNNNLIVRLGVPSGVPLEKGTPSNNVYAIDIYGKILWQIEDTSKILPGLVDGVYYAGMRPLLVVTEFMGARFLIDIESGKVIENLINTK